MLQQLPHPSFHPHHHQTVHPSSHPHQPYTVDMYRSCRRAGSRMLPLLVVGGLGFWAFSKISKLREENYDLRDRIRSDEKASLATTATTPVAMSIDEGKDAKDANKNTASSSGEWRRDWRGRRYGRPRGEEEAHRI
ncbi:BQ2448_2727 [Microbotryum intermedium]|uniref:BQ2448_2727 protein n=1 Tax=Microbotryum intermedium TaxID=269621 RepID=A0A238FEB2_9BASI|nr:BQ2448_2727 [Microbotryum intermedium]